MPDHKLRRTLPALALLGALLLPLPAAALPAGPPATEGVLSLLRSWLAGLWAKNGMMIDPDGAPLQPQPSAENGADIDPDSAKAGGMGENGVLIDPDGLNGGEGENGMMIDPNG